MESWPFQPLFIVPPLISIYQVISIAIYQVKQIALQIARRIYADINITRDTMGHLYDINLNKLIDTSGRYDFTAITEIDIDGLVQEIRNSSVLAMESRLSCTNPSTRNTLLY